MADLMFAGVNSRDVIMGEKKIQKGTASRSLLEKSSELLAMAGEGGPHIEEGTGREEGTGTTSGSKKAVPERVPTTNYKMLTVAGADKFLTHRFAVYQHLELLDATAKGGNAPDKYC
jgi:hypothetical protein